MAMVENSAPDMEPSGNYLELLQLVERLHRQLLDVVKDELDREGMDDLNSVQALLLFNIGDQELTAGELRTRGHYLGSNVSYNLKKLVDADYLRHERSEADRRAVRVSLTESGHAARQGVSLAPVGGVDTQQLPMVNTALTRIERFWADHIRFRM
jgi:DNA-binding MarR family transcriptional regulator